MAPKALSIQYFRQNKDILTIFYLILPYLLKFELAMLYTLFKGTEKYFWTSHAMPASDWNDENDWIENMFWEINKDGIVDLAVKIDRSIDRWLDG